MKLYHHLYKRREIGLLDESSVCDMDWLIFQNENEELKNNLSNAHLNDYFYLILELLIVDRPNPIRFLRLLQADFPVINETVVSEKPFNKKIKKIISSIDKFQQDLNTISFIIEKKHLYHNNIVIDILNDNKIVINKELTLIIQVDKNKEDGVGIIFNYLLSDCK